MPFERSTRSDWMNAVAKSPGRLVGLSWFLIGISASLALGWIAAKLNVAGFAPVGLLPLALGIVLGIVVFRLGIASGVACRKRLILAAIAVAILTVLAEHAWLYHDFCRQWREARAREPQIALHRPDSPWSPAEYATREATPGRIAFWCADAALVIAGAVGTVVQLQQKTERSASPAARPT
jgi:hypothetical protein